MRQDGNGDVLSRTLAGRDWWAEHASAGFGDEVTAVVRRMPDIPNQAGPVVDTSFLTLAGAMALVAVAGRGIGWALDAWVRRAAGPLSSGQGGERFAAPSA